MSSAGGEATLVATGEVAETVKNVGVIAEGTAAEVTFAGKLGENIQEFSASGNGGNKNNEYGE
ncbi:MAG: hypothetical protein J5881_01175 [Clostridia bacterium]|nr:hypothetical protein [Clostridia bacterium]